MNLTGDILRVYQGFGGFGGGQGDQEFGDSGGFGETTIDAYAFGMSGKYETLFIVCKYQTGLVLASV